MERVQAGLYGVVLEVNDACHDALVYLDDDSFIINDLGDAVITELAKQDTPNEFINSIVSVEYLFDPGPPPPSFFGSDA